MATSIKQKCFSIVESHPDRCSLHIYGENVEVFIEDSEILSHLRNAPFGLNFCLFYLDARNIVRSINVLVDGRRWVQISDCMSSFLYHFTKDKS